jgi:CRISPR system Cascade subunit CasB
MRPPGELGRLVSNRVEDLQNRYLNARRSPAAAATLAHLRRGLGKAPGEVPEIWDITLESIPRPGHGDVPSPQEHAAHAALTLYALHQQSRTTPMHTRGRSLGMAVRALARSQDATGDADREKAVRRRFDAVATATSFSETTHHLRGLISQLRAADIALDYGRLADDLERLQRPGGPKAVRLQWGRDYHRLSVALENPPTADPDPVADRAPRTPAARSLTPGQEEQ